MIMTLTAKAVDRLNELITELKNGHYIAVEAVALTLWNDGVKWDVAIHARERGEPKAFFDFFAHYKTATLDQCPAAVQGLEADFLASILAHEARSISHWDYVYTDEVTNFFVAGLERLIALN